MGAPTDLPYLNSGYAYSQSPVATANHHCSASVWAVASDQSPAQTAPGHRPVWFSSSGEANIDSDIDVLIVLNEPFDVPQERKRLSQFLAQLCLDYDTLITCVWTDTQDWRMRQSPLLTNIRRGGIVVS